MRNNIFFIVLLVMLLISSCAPLRVPTVIKNDTIEGYKYIFISPTGNLTSNIGLTVAGQFIAGSSSVNPSDLITGMLTKEGFIRLPELNPELAKETLIINYGESGSRPKGLGTATEVTIQFISAKTYKQVCSCTAEGQGDTISDDIRQAVTRCLTSLFAKEN